MAQRFATLKDVLTGHEVRVQRDTEEFETLKAQGYKTRQQLATRHATLIDEDTGEAIRVERFSQDFVELAGKGYKTKQQLAHTRIPESVPEYIPDEIDILYDDYDDYDDYPVVDEYDILEDKINELYERIESELGTIPFEKVTYKNRHAQYMDLEESKQELIDMLRDLISNSSTGFILKDYLTEIEPKINEFITAIIYDSDDSMVEYHISQIARLLNHGEALTFEQATTIGSVHDIKTTGLGWYEKSSMFTERF